ncbi:MAG TPA: PAS domain S-box protein, partial [Coleofasciculaceae cyanobacterium]
MISTNKLHLAALKLAYSITASMGSAAYDGSVLLVEQVNRHPKRFSPHWLWLLKGSVIVGSFIWLIHLIPLETWSIQLAGLSIAGLLVVLAVTLLLRRRIANVWIERVASSDKSIKNAQTQSILRLQKQSQALTTLTRPQLLERGDFKTAIREIIAVAADALEVGRVSVWLYNKDRSQLDCIEVCDRTDSYPLQGSDGSEEKKRKSGHTENRQRASDRQPVPLFPTSPPRPLTPSPHSCKPLAISNRLDAPIWLHEQTVGVICYEHGSLTVPLWTPQDENFASAIANLVAITLDTRTKRSHLDENRKQTLKALVESEARYQLLAQHSTELISRHTPEGIFLYASPSWRTLLGYEPEELIGQSAYDFFHPQDVAAIRQCHADLLNRQLSHAANYRIRRQNGDYIWLETTNTALCHPDTEGVEEILIVSRDISDRKKIKDVLRESERHFQKLTANVPGMIYECLRRTDGSVSFLFVSSGVREICELEPAQIQQNPKVLFNLIHSDDYESFKRSVALSIETLEPWRWEGRIITPSRSVKWIQGASRPELQANGDIVWDGVLIDITERKQAEAVLFESQERFRAIFEQAGVAIALFASNGQFLRVNQKLCDITGYKRRELLTKTIADITYKDDQATTQMYLREFFDGQLETLNREKRYIHKKGHTIWVNQTVSLVREPDGTPKCCVGVIEDITQRKHAEAAVQQANRERINIFESITEAFFAVDREWRFTYINSKTEQLLSCNANELLGKSLWEEFPHTVGSQFEQQYHRAVAEEVSVQFEAFYPLLQIWLLVRAYPYEGGLSVYFSDITERKQAEAALLERSHLSTLAAEVGVALANGGTLLTILQHCTEAMMQQLNAASTAIWTLNPVSQTLEQQVSSGQRFPLKPTLINLVAQSRQPYFDSGGTGDWRLGTTENLEPTLAITSQSPITKHQAPLDKRNATAPIANHFSGYPLVVEDRLIGVVTVLSNHPLTEEARHTLSWVTNAIAVAIDRYWARSELLTRRESLLFGLANQIRNSLELDRILETAVLSIRNLFGIDRCHFLWYRFHESEPYWEVVHEAKNPTLPSHIGQYKLPRVRGSAEKLLNQPIIQVDEVETLKNPRLRKLLREMGYASVLSIPIRTQGEAIGVISCGHCTYARSWDESEVELLQAVVAQVAIAIEQAEVYAEARQAASDAQAKARELEHTLHQLRTTQAKLVQSEKMSSLGQLVAGIAHEINNPVNFIHGNLAYASAYIYDLLNLLHLYQEHYPAPNPAIVEQCDLINIDFIAADLPKLLGSMQRGTDRIRTIVQSLRNFSRADEADMKRVDVHEGIESTLLILQHRLKAKGKSPEIRVYKEYGDLPVVECYPGELNQVFMNILLNAIEALKPSDLALQEHSSLYVPNPSPTITIRTRLLDRREPCNATDASSSTRSDRKLAQQDEAQVSTTNSDSLVAIV